MPDGGMQLLCCCCVRLHCVNTVRIHFQFACMYHVELHYKNFLKSIFQVSCWRHFLYGNPHFLEYIILISWILFFPVYYSIFWSPLSIINSLNVKKALCFSCEMPLLPVLFLRRFSFPFSYLLCQIKFLPCLLCMFLLWWLHCDS